jgi:hypothetical protein
MSWYLRLVTQAADFDSVLEVGFSIFLKSVKCEGPVWYFS